MRAETIRRLLVLAVCALGVTSLYLVPVDRTPSSRTAGPVRDDAPIRRPTAAVTAPVVPVAATSSAAGDPQRTVGTDRSEVDDSALTRTTSPAAEADQPSRPATSYAPFDPPTPPDADPPAAVPELELDRATEQTATFSWPAVGEDVTTYRVWLNGYLVATTSRTSATVRWFNDDSDTQIVQVRAVDAAGNQSRQAASLLTHRPTPRPTGEATVAPTSDPTATPTPAATSAAPDDAAPPPSATDHATADPTDAPPADADRSDDPTETPRR